MKTSAKSYDWTYRASACACALLLLMGLLTF
jgi:hypothetical protein